MEFKKESLNSADKNYISFLTKEISGSKTSDLSLPKIDLNETKIKDRFKCDLCRKNRELKNLEHICTCIICYSEFNVCKKCQTSFNSVRCPPEFGCKIPRYTHGSAESEK
jgi:hypothetical protein